MKILTITHDPSFGLVGGAGTKRLTTFFEQSHPEQSHTFARPILVGGHAYRGQSPAVVEAEVSRVLEGLLLKTDLSQGTVVFLEANIGNSGAGMQLPREFFARYPGLWFVLFSGSPGEVAASVASLQAPNVFSEHVDKTGPAKDVLDNGQLEHAWTRMIDWAGPSGDHRLDQGFLHTEGDVRLETEEKHEILKDILKTEQRDSPGHEVTDLEHSDFDVPGAPVPKFVARAFETTQQGRRLAEAGKTLEPAQPRNISAQGGHDHRREEHRDREETRGEGHREIKGGEHPIEGRPHK